MPDNNGNLIITGVFNDSLDIIQGSNSQKLTSAGTSNEYDLYFLKLNSSGDLLWAKQVHNVIMNIHYENAVVDASGALYIFGDFRGTVDLDPGSNTHNLTSLTSYPDRFLLKLTPNGDFVWVKQWNHNIWPRSMTASKNGSLYLIGNFQDSVDFDSGNGSHHLVSKTASDIFISKLDAQGNFIWAKQISGTGYKSASSISTDNNENIYILGNFDHTVDANPNSGTHLLTSNKLRDCFITKLDATGNFVWGIKPIITSYPVALVSQLICDHSGNILISSHFNDSVHFHTQNDTTTFISNSNYDAFLAMLAPNGNYIWAKQFASDSSISIGHISSQNQNIYVTGEFRGTVDFTPASNPTLLTSTSLNKTDAFILKMQPLNIGVKELLTSDLFTVYPNPVTNKLTILSNNKVEQVTIYTTNGTEVKRGNLNVIDVSSLAAGFYFLEVKTDGKIQTRQFIKK